MKPSSILHFALKEVTRHKPRTAACIAGYAVAVIAMVAAVGTVQHYQKVSVDVLKGVGTHFGAFIPVDKEEQGGFKNGGPYIEGVYTYLFDADFVSEIKHLPGVRDAAPYFAFNKIEHGVPLIIGGLDPKNVATWNNVCAPSQIGQGRFLSSTDSNGVLLEESYAHVTKLRAGDSLALLGERFQVVGIVNSGIRPGKANVYAPLFKVQELVHRDTSCVCINRKGCVGKPNDINVVLVEVADARNQTVVLNLVQKTLGSATISSYNCYQPASNVIGVIATMTMVLALLVGLFALAFAATVQTQSMTGRARDMGILKAIGWSSGSIVGLVMVESVFQTVAGAAIGCIGGIVFLRIFFGDLAMVSWETTVLILGLVGVGGVMTGALSAWRANRHKPSEILRRS